MGDWCFSSRTNSFLSKTLPRRSSFPHQERRRTAEGPLPPRRSSCSSFPRASSWGNEEQEDLLGGSRRPSAVLQHASSLPRASSFPRTMIFIQLVARGDSLAPPDTLKKDGCGRGRPPQLCGRASLTVNSSEPIPNSSELLSLSRFVFRTIWIVRNY